MHSNHYEKALVVLFISMAICAPTSAFQLCNSCPGDVNGNGKIDGGDAQAFVDCVLVGSTPTGSCPCADMDLNGTAELDDMSLFVDALLGNSSSASWPSYGGNLYHEAISPVSSVPMQEILWSTPVDLHPQYSGGDVLYIHYGSPLVTAANTVVVTVKTGATNGFRIEGHQATDGGLLWTLPTDYTVPPSGWTPSCGCSLCCGNRVVVPGAGGTVYRRNADAVSAPVEQFCFYGLANYLSSPATYNSNLKISTPITVDSNGTMYFGFIVSSPTPAVASSGIARISSTGIGTWTSAATAASDAGIRKVVLNCAPALSRDGHSLYVAVTTNNTSGFGSGYLVQLNSDTLAPISQVRLKDVLFPANDALLPDDGTSSPTVAPDGDVFFGAFANFSGYNNYRGWMLHFSGDLSETKIPGAFGWDDTASIVPIEAVPQYTGPASYLVLTKYNNYAGAGTGDGVNKIAVLDPTVSMVDPISGATVMNEVLTIVGPTPDIGNINAGYPNAVREWCINTAAIDVANHSALVNNEDGIAYRWDFTTNTLSESVVLTPGIGEAYTPTLVGPDGTVYAINNAMLFAIGAAP